MNESMKAVNPFLTNGEYESAVNDQLYHSTRCLILLFPYYTYRAWVIVLFIIFMLVNPIYNPL